MGQIASAVLVGAVYLLVIASTFFCLRFAFVAVKLARKCEATS